ncbi:unnamed protein product [Phytophthora fragariaefolia]|uniref:Unnamed protein product n=1 Tax=Phytophthora fragariaefolia TaxID=1490495 RepID=A0A9W7CVI8_9STRA|nr:unnamed protein product [Phytophthora fragariaefolia]
MASCLCRGDTRLGLRWIEMVDLKAMDSATPDLNVMSNASGGGPKPSSQSKPRRSIGSALSKESITSSRRSSNLRVPTWHHNDLRLGA